MGRPVAEPEEPLGNSAGSAPCYPGVHVDTTLLCSPSAPRLISSATQAQQSTLIFPEL